MGLEKRYRIEADIPDRRDGFAYRHRPLPPSRRPAPGAAPPIPSAGLARIKGELLAVLSETRSAADRILGAAEEIEQGTARLTSALPLPQRDDAEALRRHVSAIYEASHFQDLTSQRVAQIMATIEDLDQPQRPLPATPREAAKAQMLNGPALPGAKGHVTQAEIDLMFD